MKNSYKNMTEQELTAKRDALSKEYLDLRVNKVLGHLDNPLRARMIRREIARINTRLTEKELVINKG